MTQLETTLWCPHCREATPHVPMPQMAKDAEMIGQLASSADPSGYFRRHYCQQCRAIWRSVQLPVAFVERLSACRPIVEELKIEIAMLRFMLAEQRAEAVNGERAA